MSTHITQPGMLNGVVYWYDLRLYACVRFSSKGPTDPSPLFPEQSPRLPTSPVQPPPFAQLRLQWVPRWVQPAVQYLLGGAAVATGDSVNLLAAHNMYRLGFALEAGAGLSPGSCDGWSPFRPAGDSLEACSCDVKQKEATALSSNSSISSCSGSVGGGGIGEGHEEATVDGSTGKGCCAAGVTAAALHATLPPSTPFSRPACAWAYRFTPEPSLPHKHFAAAADARRLHAYDAAIRSAVLRKKEAGECYKNGSGRKVWQGNTLPLQGLALHV